MLCELIDLVDLFTCLAGTKAAQSFTESDPECLKNVEPIGRDKTPFTLHKV